MKDKEQQPPALWCHHTLQETGPVWLLPRVRVSVGLVYSHVIVSLSSPDMWTLTSLSCQLVSLFTERRGDRESAQGSTKHGVAAETQVRHTHIEKMLLLWEEISISLSSLFCYHDKPKIPNRYWIKTLHPSSVMWSPSFVSTPSSLHPVSATASPQQPGRWSWSAVWWRSRASQP